MNILWITNTIFPAPCKALGIPPPVFGGWMYGDALRIANQTDIKLAVASTFREKRVKKMAIQGVDYYLLPFIKSSSYQKNLEKHWKTICEEFKPCYNQSMNSSILYSLFKYVYLYLICLIGSDSKTLISKSI
jgi:hypothetical protein